MLIFEMRRAFDGHSATDDFVGFADLPGGKAEFAKQIKAGCAVLFGREAQAIHQAYSKNPGGEGKSQFKDAGQRAFYIFQILGTEALRL